MAFSTYRTDIQVRFGDTDALGHVNNASFAAYAELGRLGFLGATGNLVGSLILASLYVDFRRQVKFTEAVHVETHVEKLGRTSITLAQTIYASGERAADVRSVVVHYDYATHAPQALTPAHRRALEAYLAG